MPPFIALTLAGCLSAPQREAERQHQLQSYKGRTIADVAVSAGPPTARIDLAPGRAIFQWTTQRNVNTGGSAYRIPNTAIVATDPGQTFTLTCRVNFTARTSAANPMASDWIIEEISATRTDC